MQPPDVDQIEKEAIEAQGHKNFLDPPDHAGLRWIKTKKDGTCHFLGKDNQCLIYSVRPAACKIEPYTIADYDYEKNQIELELNFPFSCCCPGVCEEKTNPSSETADAARVLVQKILILTAQDLELPMRDRRVHAEARSRLLRRGVEAADLHV
jgi:Fe-S-cluster containining protein